MSTNIDKVISRISDEFKGHILNESRFYLEVDIGKYAEKSGYADITEEFRNVNALIPLKNPVNGMKVRIDGRTFVDYAQFESGVAVPGYVAKNTGLAYKPYKAKDSMILNFA